MMDMGQHSGGALPSNSLQFSPQSTLSNENFFLLDPNFSSSPSMDLCGLNPPFPSQMGSDFSSVFMESTSQNTLGLNMGSSIECFQGQGQSSSGFYAADEWSGTSISASGASSSQQHQGHLCAPSSQGQSSLTEGSFNQSAALDGKQQLQQTYENCLLTASQPGQDALGVQPLINKGLNQGGDLMSGQGRLQGTVKQLNAQGSLRGSQVLPAVGQQMMFQNELENTDFPGVFLGHQQSHSEGTISADVPGMSSQDSGYQEARPPSSMQQQGLERRNQQAVLASTLRAGLQTMQGQQGPAHASVFQGREGDNSVANYQVLNPEALFQAGHGENAAGKLMAHTQLGQQTDLQAMRGLGLQLQGKLPQSSLQTQLSNQYSNLPVHAAAMSAQQSVLQAQGAPDQLSSLQSHSNNHPLSVLRQSQSSAQLQALSQAQAQAQAQAQVQAANQQAAVNQQAVYQVRQLQGGSQQPLLHTNQQSSFHHSIQSAANQMHPGNSHNFHLNGAQQMIAQMQPRLLNPMFQGLKAGGQQVLQRSPPMVSLGYCNGIEGNVRNQMPGAIAARCIQVLMRYIQEQRKRPTDNDILFWRNLVKDFFVPGATKRWCLSSYNSSPMGRHAQGLFPMDYWFCNLCGVYPGRGFESSTDVLPRLFKIKYASGLVDELLFLDIAKERYMLPNGRLVLEFPSAVHESIFPELRVVRDGRLRVTFSSTFKIYSWEFCTKLHEEVVPRKSLLQQAQQLAKLVEDCDQEGFDKSAGDLKGHCNEFTATAKQLASKLEAPSVNDLGFSKRYVRCLQIAEVVNSMKDLISFERKTGLGPISSLTNFPTVRKLPDELLARSTLNQLINQLTQGNVGLNSSYSHLQGQGSNHLQSAVLQGSDVGLPKISSSINQLPAGQVRTQSDAHSNGLLNQQGQMQPPAVQAQSQSCNQLLTQLSAQSMSAMQGTPFGQTQPQISSQVLGHQSVNFSQLTQQIYESAGNRQLLQQPSNQPVTQSQSLNQTGQQSLPGTPQSEMSDMRTNT